MWMELEEFGNRPRLGNGVESAWLQYELTAEGAPSAFRATAHAWSVYMGITSFIRDARERLFKLPFPQAYAAKPVPGTTPRPDLAALSGNAAAALEKLIAASGSIAALSGSQGGSCFSNG